MSAGAVVAMACNPLKMCENAILMFHMPELSSSEPKDADDLEEAAAVLRKTEEMLCITLASKSGKTKEEWKELLKSDLYFTAEEALAAKLIDEVIPVRKKISNNSRFTKLLNDRILNFVSQKEGKLDMAMEDLCKEYGVADEAGLRNFIKGLQPVAPPTISESITKTITNHRKMILTNLVTDGKITPAVSAEMEQTFLNADRVKKDLQQEDNEFDRITAMFSKNEKIINFGGQSQRQKLEDGVKGKETENPLIADMKARAKK